MAYCNVCKRETNLKRHFGIGTLIGVFVTLGWWILVMPFYKKRCVFCKGNNLDRKAK